MKIAWRVTLACFLLTGALGLALGPSEDAGATHTTLRGVMIYNMHCHSGAPDADTVQQWIKNQDVQHIRVYMTDQGCTDAGYDIEPLLYPNGPVRAVTLHAGEQRANLDWNDVQTMFERTHSIVPVSYADLYDQYNSSVDFYLQFGNEPDYYYWNGSPGNPAPDWEGDYYRRQAIETFKRLAHNACGDVSQAWNSRYPDLKWSLAVPAENYDYMLNAFVWEPWDSNDPGCNDDLDAGSVVDYYDVMNPHLYGNNVIDPNGSIKGGDIFRHLRDTSSPEKYDVLLTEIGINDGGGFPNKCYNARDFVRNHLDPDPRMIGYSWFYIGGDAGYPQYQITSESDLWACSGHYS